MSSVSQRTFALALGVAFSILGIAGSGAAQDLADPVVVSPEFHRVMLENDSVRVLNVRLQPGEKDKMHSHTSSAYFVLSGEKMRFHLDRSQRDGDLKRGSVTLQGAIERHSVENIGESPINFVLFEHKAKRASETKGPDPVKESSAMYQEVDKSPRFRVLNVTIPPGETAAMHAHPDSAYYSLGSTTGVWHAADGTTTDVVFRPSSAGFFEATESHTLENTGTNPIRLLLFELLP